MRAVLKVKQYFKYLGIIERIILKWTSINKGARYGERKPASVV
jgi:hypothetical protein